jgi:chemotaxis protein methyltransferase WspC
MNEIEELLRHKIGLHTGAVGPSQIEHAVQSRLRVLGLAQITDYLKLLRASADEWNALVEAVVVTETWFFRDREPFRALTNLVRKEWLPAHPNGHLRILSLPCSTGEEPYSIAMALLDAAIAPARFQIDAFDIRPNAIAHARRAEYGRNSFRGKDLAFRANHFEATSTGHSLNLNVRHQVHFEIGNLLDEQCLAQIGVYDFIFCRNLLIYFDRATQERALRKLHRLLTPTGVILVGSAEVNLATHAGFVSAQMPLSFACRKVTKESIPLASRQRPAKTLAKKASHETMATPSPVNSPPETNASDNLARARQLADEGNLAAAGKICENLLDRHGASADAYYLLGLVRDAAGAESEAVELYRKALYLDPNHYETLLQWATLSEKNGDVARAQILHQRAERLKKSDVNTL